MQIKEYQLEAIQNLADETKRILHMDKENKMIVFQSPTGSGKTVMAANYIKKIASDKVDDLCFVWISIGKGDLHIQSKKKLEKIFKGFPKCSLVEEEFTGSRTIIDQYEVVVINWEKLRDKDQKGEWKNILMRDGEKINFREVLQNTRKFRHIILVVDEFHFGGLTERAKELYEIIKPNFILGMSATPDYIPTVKDIEEGKGYVYVRPEKVIKEGMIKKEVRINDVLGEGITSQEKVLNAAYEKRNYLKKLYEKENSKVNPLVLIQIPNADTGNKKLSEVVEFLKNKGITEENGKLAIWISDRQKPDSLKFISNNDNKIEYLIFKQAVDTGWDCPRAHILVKLRSTKSEVFEKQTVGRILRMPEQKHYKEDALNMGYIYTDQKELLISDDVYNLGTLKNMTSFLKDKVKSVELTSYEKAYNRLPSLDIDFADFFFDYMDENVNFESMVEDGFVTIPKDISREIVTNLKIDTAKFDEGEIQYHEHKKIDAILSHGDIGIMFDYLLSIHIGKFGRKSISYLKEAIIEWFRQVLDTEEWDNEIVNIEKLFIINYESYFKAILNDLMTLYENSLKDKQMKLIKRVENFNEHYHLPSMLFHNDKTEEELPYVQKYAYDRCFLRKDRSIPEQHFIDFIHKNLDKIEWWWKNGDNGKDYFAIRYEYDGEVDAFYPDFLVGFVDGTIGIFEVKSENDREAKTKTKAKAEALYKYIQEENKKRGNILFGGVVIEQNADHSGVWKINQNPVYQADDLSKWDVLKF